MSRVINTRLCKPNGSFIHQVADTQLPHRRTVSPEKRDVATNERYEWIKDHKQRDVATATGSLKFDTVRSRWFSREKSRDHPFASVSKFWLFRCNTEPAQFSVTFAVRYSFKYRDRISLTFLLTFCYFYQILSPVSFLHKFLICVFLKFSIVLIFYFSIFGPVTIVPFV